MKKLCPFIALLIFWGCATTGTSRSPYDSTRPAAGQSKKVVRVRSEYILIGTEQGVGNVNDIIQIQRATDRGLVNVGMVKIIRFNNGMTAARIMSEERGMKIRVGDFVEGYMEGETVVGEETEITQPTHDERWFTKHVKYLAVLFVSSLMIILWMSGKEDAP